MNEIAMKEETIVFFLFMAMCLGLLFSLMLESTEDAPEEPLEIEEEDDDSPLF